MKLTTKRDRRYFFRELFAYMIPMILIVGSIDVFYHFMRCSQHPEWSAPCSINWILAAMYGIFLLITIILAMISANRLRKVKKQIENEFTETINKHAEEQKVEEKIKVAKPRKIIAKKDKKSEKKDTTTKKSSKKTTTKKATTKKTVAKK